MHFSLKDLIDYRDNRYELATACIEYARKVRFLAGDEYRQVERKDALVSLKHILAEDISYGMSDDPIEEVEEDIFAPRTLEEKAQQAMDSVEGEDVASSLGQGTAKKS